MNFYTKYSCKCKYNLNSKNNYPVVLFDFQSFFDIISFKSIFFSRVRQEQHWLVFDGFLWRSFRSWLSPRLLNAVFVQNRVNMIADYILWEPFWRTSCRWSFWADYSEEPAKEDGNGDKWAHVQFKTVITTCCKLVVTPMPRGTWKMSVWELSFQLVTLLKKEEFKNTPRLRHRQSKIGQCHNEFLPFLR